MNEGGGGNIVADIDVVQCFGENPPSGHVTGHVMNSLLVEEFVPLATVEQSSDVMALPCDVIDTSEVPGSEVQEDQGVQDGGDVVLSEETAPITPEVEGVIEPEQSEIAEETLEISTPSHEGVAPVTASIIQQEATFEGSPDGALPNTENAVPPCAEVTENQDVVETGSFPTEEVIKCDENQVTNPEIESPVNPPSMDVPGPEDPAISVVEASFTFGEETAPIVQVSPTTLEDDLSAKLQNDLQLTAESMPAEEVQNAEEAQSVEVQNAESPQNVESPSDIPDAQSVAQDLQYVDPASQYADSQFYDPNAQYYDQNGDPNSQYADHYAADPNLQYNDPNYQQYADLNQQYSDPNYQYTDSNHYADPNQQYVDPNYQQYADPNIQQYADPNVQQYVDPNAQYYDQAYQETQYDQQQQPQQQQYNQSFLPQQQPLEDIQLTEPEIAAPPSNNEPSGLTGTLAGFAGGLAGGLAGLAGFSTSPKTEAPPTGAVAKPDNQSASSPSKKATTQQMFGSLFGPAPTQPQHQQQQQSNNYVDVDLGSPTKGSSGGISWT